MLLFQEGQNRIPVLEQVDDFTCQMTMSSCLSISSTPWLTGHFFIFCSFPQPREASQRIRHELLVGKVHLRTRTDLYESVEEEEEGETSLLGSYLLLAAAAFEEPNSK